MNDRTTRQKFSKIGINLILVIACLVFITPYFWLFTSALKSLPDIQRIPPEIIPLKPTLDNYQELLTNTLYAKSLLNSIIIGGVTTIIALFVCSLAGFAFAKMRFRGRDTLFMIMFATMMIPVIVVLIPSFVIMSRIGLIDTFWSLILINIAPVFGIFWMRQYISSAVHDELIEEPALIDGAGYFDIYWRVVLPIVTPALASLAIFVFTLSWNAFLQPLTFLRSPENLTYPVQLVAMQSITFPVRPTHLIMAGASLSVIPILILYIFLQRYFVSGITAGAVKE